MATVVGNYAAKPAVNESVKKFFFDRITSSSVLPRINTDPITFVIPSIEGMFIDLNQIYMTLRFRVQKQNADGVFTDIGATENVAPYNLFLYTMFSELEIEMNNELVDSTKFNYQVQSYLKMLLNSTQSARDTFLQSALYYKDQAGAFELVSRADPRLSPGNYKRATAIRNSRIVELRGRVMSDVFDTSKPLVDGISLLLRFYPESYKKCLITPVVPVAVGAQPAPLPVYQVEIMAAELSVGRIQPKQPSVQMAIYPYTKTRTQRHIFPRGLTEFGPVTIATGILPERAWVMMVTEDAFTGNVTSHRLNFRNYGLNHISISVNSETKPFKQGYNPDFANNLYSEAYMALVHEAAKTLGTADIPIRYGEYDAGFTIFGFDLTSNHSIKKEERVVSTDVWRVGNAEGDVQPAFGSEHLYICDIRIPAILHDQEGQNSGDRGNTPKECKEAKTFLTYSPPEVGYRDRLEKLLVLRGSARDPH